MYSDGHGHLSLMYSRQELIIRSHTVAVTCSYGPDRCFSTFVNHILLEQAKPRQSHSTRGAHARARTHKSKISARRPQERLHAAAAMLSRLTSETLKFQFYSIANSLTPHVARTAVAAVPLRYMYRMRCAREQHHSTHDTRQDYSVRARRTRSTLCHMRLLTHTQQPAH